MQRHITSSPQLEYAEQCLPAAATTEPRESRPLHRQAFEGPRATRCFRNTTERDAATGSKEFGTGALDQARRGFGGGNRFQEVEKRHGRGLARDPWNVILGPSAKHVLLQRHSRFLRWRPHCTRLAEKICKTRAIGKSKTGAGILQVCREDRPFPSSWC